MKAPFFHLLFALAVCAVILAGYGLWYAAIAAKSDTVSSLERQIEARTETASRLATTRTALATLASDEMTVQNYFVPETGVVAFIDGLEVRGRQLGTKITVLSVSAAGTPAKPMLDFALSVEGTFDGVMRTVGSIEFAPYAISVSKFSVGQAGRNSWRATLTLLVGSRAAVTATSTP